MPDSVGAFRIATAAKGRDKILMKRFLKISSIGVTQ
jgi:hypothetical protein